MFALGDDEWPGLSKLMEELGELSQVGGKLMGSRGNVNHWSGNLRDKFHEEIGDVLAAVEFFVGYNGLDSDVINAQAFRKYHKFVGWHNVGDPLDS